MKYAKGQKVSTYRNWPIYYKFLTHVTDAQELNVYLSSGPFK